MKYILLFIFTTFMSLLSAYGAEFPQGPLSQLTPGSLCDRPDSYRYPERIPYCDRDSIQRGVKDEVFRQYRRSGFRLNPKKRHEYKIDHLIPLCAGGSNEQSNLWPQHRSLYNISDPLEPLGCNVLKRGKISQAILVPLIIQAKKNLSLVPQTLQYLRSL